ncbi:MAG: hypothetical protein HKM03_03190 [Steroidobacteraceae bacterium]|nr:hypothetical protein [Steroidobacteraceae bacterium]
MTISSRLMLVVAMSLVVIAARASRAPFDLAGPHLRVTVTRGHTLLPIAKVPNLAVGDRLSIKALLPRTQSAHYLLIVAFLSGSTNPPPARWFTHCNTWSRKCARDGIDVEVPHGARQVLIFLAPQTGGDFKTLVGAVRGRPGAFVRTAQDLNQAMLDRSRLDTYLSTIDALNDADPSRLKAVAPLLARSLAIVVDPKCLQLMPDLQAPCLMAGRESLILEDGHSTSIVAALTSGPISDLAMQAGYTPQMRFGYYSPYIASVLDIARIFNSFRTAQYDYIPALATLHGDKIALTLNRPPSFNEPKSVLVTALPAVEPAQLPPLHAVDPKEIYCASKNSLVLPVEGAPLVFSTDYAHDMQLELTGKNGRHIDLPAAAQALHGGFVIDTAKLAGASLAAGGLGDSVKGMLHGYWGFDRYDGPRFQLVNARPRAWRLAAGDGGALIVGRTDTVHLRADSVSCIDQVMLKDPDGKVLKVHWKPKKSGEVELKLPLQNAKPGDLTLLVSEYGSKAPQPVPLRVFSAASRFDGFTLYAGDTVGTLRGSRLDEVSTLDFGGVQFTPQGLTTGKSGDVLRLAATSAAAASALQPVRKIVAQIHLKDGRIIQFDTAVLPARPQVILMAKSVQRSAADRASHVRFAGNDQLPQDAWMFFSIRAPAPNRFGRATAIQVGTVDGAEATTLDLGNGGLTLENAHVAVAGFSPLKTFGPGAFGPIQFRITINGVSGLWQPLATIVRLPQLRELVCPPTADIACKLSGSRLFLIDSIAADAAFHHAVTVPDGFPGSALPVPDPGDGRLYLRLRDDPGQIDRLALAVRRLPPPPPPLPPPAPPPVPVTHGP